ncbi:MAG: glutamate--tRNA ligase [Rickettsiales bacterium]
MTTKVRFAPSPTGFLHVGNIRIAIINYLFAKKTNGEFILRFDDTDSARVEAEYSEMIFTDMNWLGLKYDNFFKESDRLARYEQAKNQLIASGRLYECFETAEELNLQRKSQNASGVAPIYNRASLKLSKEQKQELRSKGLKPHYRFLLNDNSTTWDDKIKGKITYEGRHFSDPILIRQEDENGFGIPTYTFCSVVDDIDYQITDIIRGEDHITNTAIQIQIFEALNAKAPNFAHLALVKASEGKISKREGGFDIKTLRNQGYEAMSIISLLSQIGTSQNINITNNINDLVASFGFEKFSKSSTNYDILELNNINQKLLQILDFQYIQQRVKELNLKYNISKELWEMCKSNINFIHEIESWVEIFDEKFRYKNAENHKEFLENCIKVLPSETNHDNSWQIWLDEIKKICDKKGKELFMPIRLALTGKENGPELKYVIKYLSRSEIIQRLSF